MNGIVDDSGRAMLAITLERSSPPRETTPQAWVDTGFTGDLILPQSTVDEMELPTTGVVEAVLADGTQVTLVRYACELIWFGKKRQLEVVANEGATPLLGVGLLQDHRLVIDYKVKTVEIE